ncbi:MAG TPA: peptidylprolyl isomerase [Solirubrobacteraceae bacterium]|nr:peptidylprolyl isomerase [Solirubrobacteraceae bacterium]
MLVALLGLVGCGNDEPSVVAVRVGGTTITKQSVEHWTHVIEKGGAAGQVTGQTRGSPRQKALEFLITTQWLLGQAAMMGAAVSDRAVEHAVNDQRDVSGSEEFEQQLHATGETLDDVKLEASRELASAAIHRVLAARAARVSDAEIAAFYEANRRQFTVHESRVVDIVENLPSRVAALALIRRVGTGRRFAAIAYHETLGRGETGLAGVPGKAALVRVIFSARADVVSKPIPLNHAWTVFVVRRIRPVRTEPLDEARAVIVKSLVPERLQRIAREFAPNYRAHWIARTSCRTAFVMPGCSQFAAQPPQFTV